MKSVKTEKYIEPFRTLMVGEACLITKYAATGKSIERLPTQMAGVAYRTMRFVPMARFIVPLLIQKDGAV